MMVENKAVAVFIAIGIVAMNFHDFGDEAPARAAFEVHNDVDGVTDVRFDGAVRQVHAALQNTARESGKALLGGRGMDRRKTAVVSGVNKLQEIEGLSLPALADPGR